MAGGGGGGGGGCGQTNHSGPSFARHTAILITGYCLDGACNFTFMILYYACVSCMQRPPGRVDSVAKMADSVFSVLDEDEPALPTSPSQTARFVCMHECRATAWS